MPTRICIEVILHIAEFAVPATKVPCKCILFGCPGRCRVRIRAANDTHHKRISAVLLSIGQAVFVDVAHHVAPGKLFDGL